MKNPKPKHFFNSLISRLRSKYIYSSSLSRTILYLLILLLPTQLGKHFFPSFSYVSGVQIDYLAPTLYLTDILVLLLCILHIKVIAPLFKNKLFLIFAIFLFLNIVFSLSIPLALYSSLKILEVIFLFTTIYCHSGSHAMADRISNRVSHKIILILFLITSFFELLLSTLQFLFKHSLQGLFYFFGERYFSLSTPDIAKASLNGVEILRPYGTFSHPNSLAGFFLLLYFFILTFKPFEKYPVLKYATLLISGLLIFLSFSKIPITIFLVLNTWYVVRNPLALKCTFCKTSRVFVILVLSILFISSQGDPFTITKRISLVGNALTIFFQHPFFGVGMGNYLIAQNQFPIHYSYFFLQPVHNIFLLYLCESGIFLFAFTLYTLVQVFKKLWGNQTFQYMLVIVGVTGMFDHYWLTLQQNLLLFPLLLALL